MRFFFFDTATLFRWEMLRYRRDRAYWVGQIAFPLVVVGFIGFGLNDVVRLPSGAGYLSHLASGIMALLVGSAGVGGGMSLIADRDSGFLRALMVAPVSRTSVVLAKMLARGFVSILLIAFLVTVLALFTPIGLPHPAAALLAVIAVSVSFLALGVGLAARLRSLESYRLLAGLVTVPIYFLSGIFYPVETLPLATRLLAHLNPLTYGVDLMRYGLLGVNEIPLSLSFPVLAGLTLLATALAVRSFDRQTLT